MRQRFTGLWREPAFLTLWAGQTISVFGDQVSLLALPLSAVLSAHATAAQMGVLTLAQTAPYLLIQLIAGVWVDRVRRRPLLIAADLGRALLLASIPLAALVGRLGLPQLYLVAFLANVLTVLFSVSYQAYLPALVSREHLSDGNAKLTVSRQVAQLAGPGLAGVAVQALTAPVAILVDAVSFVGSGLCLATLRVAESSPAHGGRRRRLWRDIGEGLHWVAGQPLLRAGAGSAGTYNFFNTVLTTVYLLYLTRDLRLTPAAVGVIQMAGGVGGLAGAVVATRITGRIGLGRAIMWGLALASGANLLIPAAGRLSAAALPLLLSARFMSGIGQPLYNINQASLRQALTPDRLRGRMSATMQFLVAGTAPLGALLGTALGRGMGPWATLLIGAAGTVLAVLWVVASPLRTLRAQPTTPAAD